MRTLYVIVSVLLIIGGLNWGMIGVFDVNPISRAFGDMTSITRLIYILVGLAALYEVVMLSTTHWDIHYRRPVRDVHDKPILQ